MTRSLLALALCASFAPVAAAQQAIPADLATALAASGGFTGDGEPTILVGAMPASLKLSPPVGGTLLGSATFGRSITSVFVFRAPSDSAVNALRSAAVNAGWKAAQRPVYNYGGFMPNPRVTGVATNAPSTAPTTYCGDSVSLNFRVARRRNDSSWVAIRVTPWAAPPGFSECNMRMPRTESTRAPLPTLYNPPAAAIDAGQCFRALYPQQDEMQPSLYNATSGILRVGMSADAIADYYTKQLADSGWAPQGLAQIPALPALRTWTRRDSLGLRMLTLTVTPAPRDSMCYQMMLEVKPAPRSP